MDIKEEEILEQYENLPARLKEALDSSFVYNIIEQITKRYLLKEKDQETIKYYVGLTLLGFIPPNKLLEEINLNEKLDIEERFLVEIIREINSRIFYPLHLELERIYRLKEHFEKKPSLLTTQTTSIQETLKTTESEKTKEIFSEEKTINLDNLISDSEPIKISIHKEEIKPKEENEPLIIQEKEDLTPQKETKTKSFSLPFKLFSFKNLKKDNILEGIKVKIEEPEKIVHYNEQRSNLEFNEELIRPEKISQPEIKTEISSQKNENQENQKSTLPLAQIEGNTIILKPENLENKQ